jgi:uncharacterized protein (TIGR00266 family)
MQTRTLGTTMPVLEVELQPNESVFSESGELSWMTPSIQMTTHTQMGGGGGVFGVFKRAVAGASIFMTEYRAMQTPGVVSFATKVPGHIVPVQVGQGMEYLVHRHGFLCATPQVTVTLGFQQSLGAGIFGGSGFLLQKLAGEGTAWLELSGELVQRTLAPGEMLMVHPGHVGAFQTCVNFQITMVRGIRNMLFGADSLFLAQLAGPGTIWLQTLPISRLAQQINEYLPHYDAQAATPAGVVGGIVGSILTGQ